LQGYIDADVPSGSASSSVYDEYAELRALYGPGTTAREVATNVGDTIQFVGEVVVLDPAAETVQAVENVVDGEYGDAALGIGAALVINKADKIAEATGLDGVVDKVVDKVKEYADNVSGPDASDLRANHSQGETDDFYNDVSSSSTGVIAPNTQTLSKDVWDIDPKVRGREIETYLTETDYKDWQRSDDFINPKTNEPFKSNNFPKIDFQQGNNVVSLKTVNTNGVSWMNDMKNHITDLDKTKITVSGQPANKILDIRVQPGGYDEAKSLIKFGSDNNIIVVIKEIGG